MSDTAAGPVAVIGATGAVGTALVDALQAQGRSVRVVSRDRSRLERLFGEGGAEIVEADVSGPAGAEAAVAGCSLCFLCVGLPQDLMHVHPVIAEYVGRAAAAARARCVAISSYWAYLPVRSLPLNEDHPREGGPPWAQFRRDAEDVLTAEGAAVLNLPDFFGPGVRDGSLQQALEQVARGGALSWIGRADNRRDFIYVPDAAQVAVALSAEEDAFGQRWIVPGSGPVSADELAAMAGELLGRRVRVRAAGPGLLQLLSLFSERLRAFMPMAADYAAPIEYDGSRLAGLIGEPRRTDYRTALKATLEALQR